MHGHFRTYGIIVGIKKFFNFYQSPNLPGRRERARGKVYFSYFRFCPVVWCLEFTIR